MKLFNDQTLKQMKYYHYKDKIYYHKDQLHLIYEDKYIPSIEASEGFVPWKATHVASSYGLNPDSKQGMKY